MNRIDVQTEEYADGSIYRGQIVDGEKQGIGMYYMPDQTVLYFGEWKHDQYEGRGTYLYDDGERYEGQLKKGQRNGMGQMTYRNGCVYKGCWLDGRKDGEGI